MNARPPLGADAHPIKRPGPQKRRRSGPPRLSAHTQAQIENLKPAERRVLEFLADYLREEGPVWREWIQVSHRVIAKECKASLRDVGLALALFKARGLLKIRSNNGNAKRRTQIAFLVNPAHLLQCLVDGNTPL